MIKMDPDNKPDGTRKIGDYTIGFVGSLAGDVPANVDALLDYPRKCEFVQFSWNHSGINFSVEVVTLASNSDPKLLGTYLKNSSGANNCYIKVVTGTNQISEAAVKNCLDELSRWLDSKSNTNLLLSTAVGSEIKITSSDIAIGDMINTVTIRELGAVLLSALQKQAEIGPRLDEQVDLVMRVLASNAGKMLINDNDLPVKPLEE